MSQLSTPQRENDTGGAGETNLASETRGESEVLGEVGVSGACEAEDAERMPTTNPVVGVCERREHVTVNTGKLGSCIS